jgi:hypothetical protein
MFSDRAVFLYAKSAYGSSILLDSSSCSVSYMRSAIPCGMAHKNQNPFLFRSSSTYDQTEKYLFRGLFWSGVYTMMRILVLSLIISRQALAFLPIRHPGLLQNSIPFYAATRRTTQDVRDDEKQIQHCIPLDQLSLDDLPRVGGCVYFVQ